MIDGIRAWTDVLREIAWEPDDGGYCVQRSHQVRYHSQTGGWAGLRKSMSVMFRASCCYAHLLPVVICFELFNPPVFQSEWFNRSTTGDSFEDNKRYRQRLASLNGQHGAVASYAHQLRIILHEPRDLEKFSSLCCVAEIPHPFRTKVEANANGFFSPRRLFALQRKIKTFEWSIAFQIEALLRSGLVSPDDLETTFFRRIEELYASRPLTAADSLRHYTEALRTRGREESILECYERVVARETPEEARLHPGLFHCHHLTVTPSRWVLEGPYIIQSNRVIRQYEGFEEHFIRVDFRDEDRLHFRWERDVSHSVNINSSCY